MLIEFKVKNFKSFKDEIIFSMEKKSGITGLDYSILKEKDYDILPTSVIYGANAAGKSNLLEAMNFLKHLVKVGSLKDFPIIELFPHIFNEEKDSTHFYVKFTNNSKVYEYFLEIEIGEFFGMNDKNYSILKEVLKIDKIDIFSREENKLKKPKDLSHLESGIVKSELFLKKGLQFFNKDIYEDVCNWFEKKFEIIEQLSNIAKAPDLGDKKILKDNFINKIAETVGSTGEIYYETHYEKENKRTLITSKIKNVAIGIPSIFVESYGTNRIIDIIPLIHEALNEGKFLAIDELDTAINPQFIMSVVNLFHNDEININKAQLIFTTHNPIYLNVNLFRRDEINFVEKNEKKSSGIYKLSDFKTNNQDVQVRKSTNILSQYMKFEYGALNPIDLTDIFKEKIEVKSNE